MAPAKSQAGQPVKRRRKNKKRTNVSSASDTSSSSDSASEVEIKKKAKKEKKTKQTARVETRKGTSDEESEKNEPEEPPELESEPKITFSAWYLRQVAKELEEDLDKARSAGDFSNSSLPVLINALQQGASTFTEEEKNRIIAAT